MESGFKFKGSGTRMLFLIQNSMPLPVRNKNDITRQIRVVGAAQLPPWRRENSGMFGKFKPITVA